MKLVTPAVFLVLIALTGRTYARSIRSVAEEYKGEQTDRSRSSISSVVDEDGAHRANLRARDFRSRKDNHYSPLFPARAEPRNFTSVRKLKKVRKGTVYFGQDNDGQLTESGVVIPLRSFPNAIRAYNDFLASGVGFPGHDDFSSLQPDKRTFFFLEGIGNAMVDDIHDKISIQKNAATSGMYPLFGSDNFLRVPRGSVISFYFDSSMKGFGFFCTDMRDERLTKRVTIRTSSSDGSNAKVYKPDIENADGVANGAVVFYGVTDPEGFRVVTINNSVGDGFGIALVAVLG